MPRSLIRPRSLRSCTCRSSKMLCGSTPDTSSVRLSTSSCRRRSAWIGWQRVNVSERIRRRLKRRPKKSRNVKNCKSSYRQSRRLQKTPQQHQRKRSWRRRSTESTLHQIRNLAALLLLPRQNPGRNHPQAKTIERKGINHHPKGRAHPRGRRDPVAETRTVETEEEGRDHEC